MITSEISMKMYRARYDARSLHCVVRTTKNNIVGNKSHEGARRTVQFSVEIHGFPLWFRAPKP